MSKRLQVLLDEDELRDIQDIASSNHMTLAEWVRQALRAARRNAPRGNVARKIDAIKAAVQLAYPTSDITEMLSDIEGGYLGRQS